MPAAVAKGILLSISIITALGLAVIENPQIQEWLEEQRRKIAELLRSIGEELDPQSRRAAEAFAFEGRNVANDDSLRREAAGSIDAAALATGRSLSSPSTIRRIPVRGPSDPDEAEERRRKGREYLARRNQQLYELQHRRNAPKAEGAETPPSPTFDELVDAEGNLKSHPIGKELSSLQALDPIPEPVKEEMRQIEQNLTQPLAVGEASSVSESGWQLGSVLANPFGDEYALERSMTPKPPVPPKIELDRAPTPPISIPGSYSPIPTEPQPEQHVHPDELSYEEQLAIAMSLSEQESSSNSATVRQHQPEEDEDQLRAAIAASLREMDVSQAAHAIAHDESATPQAIAVDLQPLVDLTPPEPQVPTARRPSEWESLFNPHFSSNQEPLTLSPPTVALSEASDELYRLTPELTRARLARFDAQQIVPTSSSQGPRSLPFDPVRDAARVELQPAQEVMDASFYSAADGVLSPASTHTLDRETPQLVDVTDDGMRTPTSRAHSSFGFQTDSDSDTFASISAHASRPQSRPRSEESGIVVMDMAEDSDVDMLSEEGDGIATPDSWSEVSADSDMEEDPRQRSRVSV